MKQKLRLLLVASALFLATGFTSEERVHWTILAEQNHGNAQIFELLGDHDIAMYFEGRASVFWQLSNDESP